MVAEQQLKPRGNGQAVSFPHLGDRVSVWTTDKHGETVLVEGRLVAIRPKARNVTILDKNDKRHVVPFETIIDRYGE